MLDEDRQQAIRGVNELLFRLLRCVLQEHLLVLHARTVVNPVVDRQAIAEILQHRPTRRAGDHAEARDDQPLVEHLHLEDLLLDRVGLERHVRELVQVRIALAGPSGFRDQLQPRLRVPRLVLHHRRVVELRLGIGRDVQKL